MENKEYFIKGLEFLESCTPSKLASILSSPEYYVKFIKVFVPRLKRFINGEKQEEDIVKVAEEMDWENTGAVTSVKEG